MRPLFSNTMFRWFFATVFAAIIGLFLQEFWGLIKAGSVFDLLEAVAGKVQEAHFIRKDLVGETKQSVAQWVLSFSILSATVAMFFSKATSETWLDCFMGGIPYGFALGTALLFLLSYFQRFEDIHSAIGSMAYGLAAIATLGTLLLALAMRIKDRV